MLNTSYSLKHDVLKVEWTNLKVEKANIRRSQTKSGTWEVKTGDEWALDFLYIHFEKAL